MHCIAIDNTLATTPAASQLAFSTGDMFSLDSKTVLEDTVNYFLFFTAEELNAKFGSAATTTDMPDFLINYVVAVACNSTTQLTTITLEKVETGDSSIDVYLSIQRGEQQKTSTKPAKVFAIERRDGFPVMQFYVNGKEYKGIVLPVE